MCHSFCSKMFRNKQKWAKCGFKWVFRSTRKPLGNCSEIIRILVLAMTTADDGVGEVIMSEKLLLVFHCFTNNMVLFGFAKSKAINFSFKDYFHRSICTVGLRIICTLIASIARADRDRDQWSARILLAPWSRSARILLAKWSRAFLIASIFASNHSTLSNSVACRFQYSSFTLQFSIFLHRNHALVFLEGILNARNI